MQTPTTESETHHPVHPSRKPQAASVKTREQRARSAEQVDAQALASELAAVIEGEVRFGDGDRAMYAADASNYRQVPIGVVIPKSADDVIEIVRLCRKYGAPIVSRGGGTSLAGQACNVAVVIDYSKYMNRVLEIDAEKKIARVQPGTILDDLRTQASRHGLTLGPDPATHDHCTIGGMIGNNSCGIHAQMSGRMEYNVEELDILLYDGTRLRVGKTDETELGSIIAEGGRRGTIYRNLKDLRDHYADEIRKRFPDIPRKVSGFNLDELLPENGFHVARSLVGTEGTCAVILEATVKLIENPKERVVVLLGYPDVYSAGDHVPEVLKYKPIGLEGIDDRLTSFVTKKHLHPSYLKLFPKGGGWLVVEFGGDSKEDAKNKAQALMDDLKQTSNPPTMSLYVDEEEKAKIWEIRESGLGATAFVPGHPDSWPGWEDSAVPPDQVGKYLRDLRALFKKYGYECALYGHFGQGCIHVRINFDLVTEEGIRNYREFVGEAADLVVRYGGSLSGEHGDGQARAELLPKMFGEDLVSAMREFKSIWDPDWKLNPGKVVSPNPITSHLRLGTTYNPLPVSTHFQYPEDKGAFARATLRCVGVGKCRRLEGKGTMCPSFMVTREEKHSTRGRAHLLFEMLQGQPLKDKWKTEAVKDALDLCLACKGCKGDCPVNVDMATYKAEFLAHYYKGSVRPMPAYTMGLIYWWSRVASKVPTVVNALSGMPLVSNLMKRAAGISTKREIPKFAKRTFKDWHLKHPIKNRGRQKVILWPDTFNNYFHPETAQAALHVLESAGFDVRVPHVSICCGRPLYDFGFLDQARRQLKEIFYVLGPALEKGIPIVVLEPSCLSVFRDESVNLFPNEPDAIRLKTQSYLLSEFIEKFAPDFEWPRLEASAVLHGHCHQKSVLNMSSDCKALKNMGVEYNELQSGCCGMAGAFGFEADKYDVSVACGERVLLPKVRSARRDELIVTNGFSCREQIRQQTGRVAMHMAQVIEKALRAEGRLFTSSQQRQTREEPGRLSNQQQRNIAEVERSEREFEATQS